MELLRVLQAAVYSSVMLKQSTLPLTVHLMTGWMALKFAMLNVLNKSAVFRRSASVVENSG